MTLITRMIILHRRYAIWILISAVAGLIASQADTLVAFMAAPVVNELFKELNPDFLLLVPIFVFILVMSKSALMYIHGLTMGLVTTRVTLNIRNRVYRHYLRFSLKHFDSTTTGEMITRMMTDAEAYGIFLPLVMSFLTQSAAFLGLAAVVFYRNWELATLAIVLAPPAVLPLYQISRSLRRYSRKRLKEVDSMNSLISETIGGIRVVKAFQLEEDRRQKYAIDTGKIYSITLRSSAVGLLSSPLVELVAAASTGAVIYYGGIQVLNQDLDVGEFFSFVVAAGLIYDPLRSLSRSYNKLQACLASADRVFKVIDTEPDMVSADSAREIDSFSGAIHFDHVTFKYDHKDVIKDVSLTVNCGERVALVGPSGAGKTTMLSLLPRLYDPQKGKITIDGLSLRDIKLECLPNLIAVVAQDTFLFHDTVAKKYRIWGG